MKEARQVMAKMTGMSRAQVARLIGGYLGQGQVKPRVYQRRKFVARYTAADLDLLAYVDQQHGTLSGPATRRILERECREFGQPIFQRLAGISVAQIYRFRKTAAYRKRNTRYRATRPTPQGRPGYLRIDTVHQGDRDGNKGLFHINAVDELQPVSSYLLPSGSFFDEKMLEWGRLSRQHYWTLWLSTRGTARRVTTEWIPATNDAVTRAAHATESCSIRYFFGQQLLTRGSD